MRIIYLIPAYNEEGSLDKLADNLSTQLLRFPQLQAYIIDNASTDNTKAVIQALEVKHPWIHGIYIKEKGMGVAFRYAIREIRGLHLGSEDWVIFSAADLPFGFSDLESFIEKRKEYESCITFVGSKSHPNSQINRSIKRTVASWIFYLLRWFILKMHTKDPHGTIFLRADQLNTTDNIVSKDYFFSTELIYYMEQQSKVVEMPIILKPEIRPSKVNLIIDGIKVLKQIIRLRLRQTKIS